MVAEDARRPGSAAERRLPRTAVYSRQRAVGPAALPRPSADGCGARPEMEHFRPDLMARKAGQAYLERTQLSRRVPPEPTFHLRQLKVLSWLSALPARLALA